MFAAKTFFKSAAKPASSPASSLVLLYITAGVVAPFALPLKSSLTQNNGDHRLSR